jgi:probable F420-dependent oxidoreductase
MVKSFRFGVGLSHLPKDNWVEHIRRIEELGYSSVFLPDHFGTQWEPVASLAAIAAVTKNIRVGSFVYSVDYRHPVVLAKAASTIHLLSGGRHEFGIGAGWSKIDYENSGIPLDRPNVRIERLDEALTIIRSMWTQERTSFSGKHYQIKDISQAAELPEGEHPRILVGGGGRKVLTVAAQHADIVGICPRTRGGKVTSNSVKEMTIEGIREKVSWVQEAAENFGRRFDEIELNIIVYRVVVTNNLESVQKEIAKRYQLTIEEIAECPIFLIGSATEIQKQLKQLREKTGINYFSFFERDKHSIEQFSQEIIKPLSRAGSE